MPEAAKLVTLDLARKKLYVDGNEFPWCISEEGPQLGSVMAANEIRTVTLTFLTEDIEVIPEAGAPNARQAENDAERLRLAREALIGTGYFTPDEVGPDVAPRITEMFSALSLAPDDDLKGAE